MRFVEGVCEAQKILMLLCTISFVLTFPLQVFTIKKMVKCEWFGTVAQAKRLGLGSPRGLGHKDVNVLPVTARAVLSKYFRKHPR